VKLAFGIDAAERRDVTADQIFKDRRWLGDIVLNIWIFGII